MKNEWGDLWNNINLILEKYRYSHPSKVRHDVRVDDHIDVNLSVSKVFGSYEGVSINQIPTLLERYLKHDIASAYQIPYIKSDYKDKSVSDAKIDPDANVILSNAVIINQTRISTFIAFTDGKNILLFDRKCAAKDKTQVITDNFDVFGSVQFENKTIFNKIGKNDFAESKMLNVEYIPGFAIEDNFDKSRKRETVIMIGYAVFLSEEDLKKGVNGEAVDFYPINDTLKYSKNLTSKAKLSVTYLYDRLHSEP